MTKDQPDTAGTLYYEKTPGGYVVVTEKTDEEEAQVDLELLFNAVISNKEKINSIFLNGGTE